MVQGKIDKIEKEIRKTEFVVGDHVIDIEDAFRDKYYSHFEWFAGNCCL